jgi:hypothetical protein
VRERSPSGITTSSSSRSDGIVATAEIRGLAMASTEYHVRDEATKAQQASLHQRTKDVINLVKPKGRGVVATGGQRACMLTGLLGRSGDSQFYRLIWFAAGLLKKYKGAGQERSDGVGYITLLTAGWSIP